MNIIKEQVHQVVEQTKREEVEKKNKKSKKEKPEKEVVEAVINDEAPNSLKKPQEQGSLKEKVEKKEKELPPFKKFKQDNKECMVTHAAATHCKIVKIIDYLDSYENYLMLRLDVASAFKNNKIIFDCSRQKIVVVDGNDAQAQMDFAGRFPNFKEPTKQLLIKRYSPLY